MSEHHHSNPDKEDSYGKSEEKHAIIFDKRRVFWLCILTTLIFMFVFTFGYWVGHNQDTNIISMPENMSLDNQMYALNQDNNDVETNTAKSPTSNNIAEDQPVTPDTKQEDLEILDNATNQSSTNASETTSTIITSPAIATIHHKKESKKADSSPSPQKHFTAKRPKGTYVIQLASIQSLKRALEIKHLLQKKGYYDFSIIKKGILHRLIYGRYKSYEEAKKEKVRIENITKIKSSLIKKVL